ncbi:cadherin-like protein 26 isoform X2 [Denticeps clupeoides]|uniref:Cadherin domain-containing protein n=1 Tax=Denticeps clupeoides TaxID=299321 RepID=A0AAY4CWV3_9TELE|nr:cadherin-like protein 26 isoform X2 [Denticeps clupeoides]
MTTPLYLILIMGLAGAASSGGMVRQKRAWIIDSFKIEEEYPGPFPYVLGQINVVEKQLQSFLIHGSGVDEEPLGVLAINQVTGTISVLKKVDFETCRMLKLRFEALDPDGKVNTRLGVEVLITDVNDNAPTLANFEISLDESKPQGSEVIIVKAEDKDDNKSPNGTFTLRIVSVTPEDRDVEFFLEQKKEGGVIMFKGCLDYQRVQKYMILVEAKDHGPKVQLSSTGTVVVKIRDKNNHQPEFTGQAGPIHVKEREQGIDVLRLSVMDKDEKGTPAWRVKYNVHGDTDENFKITTDLETNTGILTLKKGLDFEKGTVRNISVSAENEEPYFSCQVKSRPEKGLWDVKVIKDLESKTIPLTFAIDDVNDPPIFNPDVKSVTVNENTPIGAFLEKFTAVDPDITYSNQFHYQLGDDPNSWVSVDAKTGEVTTVKVLDREGPHVNDSVYVVTLLAVDHGSPQMTATGTLSIFLMDQNDNVPQLNSSRLYMCLSDEPTSANISAYDLDLPPYSYPFHFELVGDTTNKWKVDPSYGTTVSLVKENMVFSGHHMLTLKISDSQGHYALHNLSVTVCDCVASSSCLVRMASSARLGGGAFGIIALALLLLLVVLLLASLITCKNKKSFIPFQEEGNYYQNSFNTEGPGTDCKVEALSHLVYTDTSHMQNPNTSALDNKMNVPSYAMFGGHAGFRKVTTHSLVRKESMMSKLHAEGAFEATSLDIMVQWAIQNSLQKLRSSSDRLDYEPHVYALEGEKDSSDPELDPIPILENEFKTDLLQDLDLKFTKLASICKPGQSFPYALQNSDG